MTSRMALRAYTQGLNATTSDNIWTRHFRPIQSNNSYCGRYVVPTGCELWTVRGPDRLRGKRVKIIVVFRPGRNGQAGVTSLREMEKTPHGASIF
jgi:hypothetical protein